MPAVGIVGTGDQRSEHGTPGDAQDVGSNAGKLDTRVFKDLVKPLSLARTLLDQRLAIARNLAQFTNLSRWYEARAHQAVRDQLGDPGRVGYVGLAARARSADAVH